jgi:hypothetical protein
MLYYLLTCYTTCSGERVVRLPLHDARRSRQQHALLAADMLYYLLTCFTTCSGERVLRLPMHDARRSRQLQAGGAVSGRISDRLADY